ncbi:MAG: hypothetical protein RLZZ385_83 [Pseudomonadota bacterium]|jgi:aminoglycoside/choline kinase family phosphotransferase
MDQRRIALTHWARHQLTDLLNWPGCEIVLETLSGDASFRRYFRARLPTASYVLVDAPPEREDCQVFVTIGRAFSAAGLHTPAVLRVDFTDGFMLLEDLGDTLYLNLLSKADSSLVDSLYDSAIDALLQLQQHQNLAILPAYDATLLRREMSLFDEWFCGRFLELELSSRDRQIIGHCHDVLVEAALEQTRVAVHRDYHSRNLMVPPGWPQQKAPGVIDFQDAVHGPYTYDLVSLLRDCYIRWPEEYVTAKALGYKQAAETRGIIPATADADFLRHFDLMGLQRHLKVMGIFCRLCLRDGKPAYLADIPLVIDYFVSVAARHRELEEFSDWFQQRILPLAQIRLSKAAPCAP